MSASWSGGSTRSWRRLRRFVLERDGWSCQRPDDDRPGQLCGAYADTAGHIVDKADGGLDTADNLRAECRRHNYGGGAASSSQRRTRRERWSW